MDEEKNKEAQEINCTDENCDHNHDKTVFITLDDDTEIECSVLGIFKSDGKEYIALRTMGQDIEEEVLVYAYSENGDEITLDLIESDAEYETVIDTFYDMFDFDEYDDDLEYEFDEYDEDDDESEDDDFEL